MGTGACHETLHYGSIHARFKNGGFVTRRVTVVTTRLQGTRFPGFLFAWTLDLDLKRLPVATRYRCRQTGRPEQSRNGIIRSSYHRRGRSPALGDAGADHFPSMCRPKPNNRLPCIVHQFFRSFTLRIPEPLSFSSRERCTMDCRCQIPLPFRDTAGKIVFLEGQLFPPIWIFVGFLTFQIRFPFFRISEISSAETGLLAR